MISALIQTRPLPPEPSLQRCLWCSMKKLHTRCLVKDNPIGKHLQGDRREYEVVGLVPNMKDASGRNAIAYPPLTRRDFALPPVGDNNYGARAFGWMLSVECEA